MKSKITRLNPNATARQLLAFLKERPWYSIKAFDGEAWIVRCAYVTAAYPVIDHIEKASMVAL